MVRSDGYDGATASGGAGVQGWGWGPNQDS